MASVAAKLTEAATAGEIPINSRTGTIMRPPPKPTVDATIAAPAAKASIPAYVHASDTAVDSPYAPNAMAEAASEAAATTIQIMIRGLPVIFHRCPSSLPVTSNSTDTGSPSTADLVLVPSPSACRCIMWFIHDSAESSPSGNEPYGQPPCI